MLRSGLIEAVQAGGACAFVGSGASVDAGCPSWDGLVAKVVEALPEASRRGIGDDLVFTSAIMANQFALCFSRIAELVGRDELELSVRAVINKHVSPSEIHKELADWPFMLYITTNYDGLLESQLNKSPGSNWVPVGNSAEETRKVSRDATGVVWHVHGSASLGEKEGRLVLTQEDYEELYLLEESPMVRQLGGVLAQRRAIFVGFSFADAEVMRLLKRVGRLSNPARPIYAFLSGLSKPDQAASRKELLERYNIDVITYEVESGSHRQLLDLLKVYGALILKRSLKFGYPQRPCPSYDPETTGLLLYNEFCRACPEFS